MGIALIYNMPYMPQFNGMENVWRHVKAAYRQKKTEYLCAGLSWKNEEVVKDCLNTVDKMTVRNCIVTGIDTLDAALPVYPIPGEQLQDEMNNFVAQFDTVVIDSPK